MVDIITFNTAISDSRQFSKRHLLLGNGFSIACRPSIFHYGSLFSQANFEGHPNIPHVFEALETEDFEVAIKALETSAKLSPIYTGEIEDASENMMNDAKALKEILISTVAGTHPEGPFDIQETEFNHCRKFLQHFLGKDNTGYVFTLNYDLLLYWTLMHSEVLEGEDEIVLSRDDGFGNDEDDSDTSYVVWQGETNPHSTRVHFLHGAMHLFDAGHQLQKYTWIRSGERLVEQARNAIESGKFPVFVSEGDSKLKYSKIRHNAFLYQSLKVFTKNAQMKPHCFFLHGHSLAVNDDHILRKLGKGRCSKIYVSIHGNPMSEANKNIIKRAYEIVELRPQSSPLSVGFYDAESANVWG